MRKYFLDTNVVIDYFLNREEQLKLHTEILETSRSKELYLSSLSVHIIVYTLKIKNNSEIFKQFQVFISHVNIIPLADKILKQALLSEYTDFEDMLQYLCAMENCNYFCTRDKKNVNKINKIYNNKLVII